MPETYAGAARRALGYAGVGVVVGAMALVGLSAWWGLYSVSRSAPAEAFDTARRWQPGGGPAWVPAMRQTLPLTPPAGQQALLAAMAPRFPLDATLRLRYARAAHATGRPAEEVLDLLATATSLQPHDAELQWRAAMLALEAGGLPAATGYLRRFVALRPEQIDRAVLVARRWLTEPESLLAALVPEGTAALRALLPRAARWRDWPLARAAWRRLPAGARADPELAGTYADQLIRAGRGDEAAGIWAEAEPAFRRGQVFNGDFSRPLRQRSGFDWRFRTPAGAEISRDQTEHASPAAALRIRFDGEHNLRLNGPEQHVTVRPGTRYRLTGRWRARGLTTRALPHWIVASQGPDSRRHLATIEAPGPGDWGWRAFETEFSVPEAARLVRIQLRRLPTDNLDRFIAGTLWLDDIELEPAGP